jgi:hypothetical protein
MYEYPPSIPMTTEWIEKISTWFKDGTEGSKTLLGIPWDVEVVKDDEHDVIVATHPKIPYKIGVLISPEFASLHIDPGIYTDAMDVAERMKIYKRLLHINTDLNQMKTGLLGIEDQVILTVDLNLVSLSKGEFNDALTLLVMGGARVIEALELTDDLAKSMMERNAAMIIEMMEKGETREQILDFLIHRVGLEKKYAEDFMKNVAKLVETKEEEAEEGSEKDEAATERMYR